MRLSASGRANAPSFKILPLTQRSAGRSKARPLSLIPIAFGIAASLATLAGGLLALRLQHRIVFVLGITAGVVLGVAVFDLVPEALELAHGYWSSRALVGFVAVGLGFYMLLDRALRQATWLPAGWRTHLGPATLTLHSLMDGMGIGIAFQISADAGWLIALAVLTHDIADGVNTVSLCLAARSERAARRWLLLNGFAPLLGVLLGLGITVPPAMLAPLMAGFAGVFLYIGACELLPRSYALDPRLRTTLASIAGMMLMFAVTSIAH
jgi:zinc transporter ZupT